MLLNYSNNRNNKYMGIYGCFANVRMSKCADMQMTMN
jgi:hypothetical protein